MSEFAVTQALACVVTNSKIPELEAEIIRLQHKNAKLSKIYNNAMELKAWVSPALGVCTECLAINKNLGQECRICIDWVCVNCRIMECDNCGSTIHKACKHKLNAQILDCGHCWNCCEC